MSHKTPQIADALALHQKGQLDAAMLMYDEILKSNPKHGDALHLRGLIAFQQGDLNSADQDIRKAIAVKPKEVNYHTNLGRVLNKARNFESAAVSFRNALKLTSDVADTHSDLAAALIHLGDLSDAIEACKSALALNPNHINAKINLVRAHFDVALKLQEEGHFVSSISSYNSVLEIDPLNVDAWCNLGNAEREQANFKQAIFCYEKALELEPELSTIYGNMGVALHETGRFSEAVAYYQKGLKLNPEDAETHRNLAMTYLLIGDFAKGWEEYKWRWETNYFRNLQRQLPMPEWSGEDLNGKSILVHAEQGFGDTIQFVRYLPLLNDYGARVIFECQPVLVDLIKTMSNNIVLPKGEAIPETEFHIPLLSLPGLFDTGLLTIPPSIGLGIRPCKSSIVQASSKTNVGIAWRGSPEFKRDSLRSPGLEPFIPLFDNADINFYSLQKDGGREELQKFDLKDKVIDLGSEFVTFSDTAAAIKSLDLIITSDTAIAHLAGSLGCQVWVLLSRVPDWRWLLDRKDTPWYPSMRLFRQQKSGDWNKVVQDLIEELSI